MNTILCSTHEAVDFVRHGNGATPGASTAAPIGATGPAHLYLERPDWRSTRVVCYWYDAQHQRHELARIPARADWKTYWTNEC